MDASEFEELAHLGESNPRFWQLVGGVFPDIERRKNALARRGAQLWPGDTALGGGAPSIASCADDCPRQDDRIWTPVLAHGETFVVPFPNGSSSHRPRTAQKVGRVVQPNLRVRHIL
jgi:hypothetical protein